LITARDYFIKALRAGVQQINVVPATVVDERIGQPATGKPVSGTGVPAMRIVPVIGVGVAVKHF